MKSFGKIFLAGLLGAGVATAAEMRPVPLKSTLLDSDLERRVAEKNLYREAILREGPATLGSRITKPNIDKLKPRDARVELLERERMNLVPRLRPVRDGNEVSSMVMFGRADRHATHVTVQDGQRRARVKLLEQFGESGKKMAPRGKSYSLAPVNLRGGLVTRPARDTER
ncbi:MAG: hypothetical protein RL380_493 [Verrucomicrobiota bacterium]